ncbi:MAG: hypothetical protein ABEK50_10600 [bacterium]
MDRNWLNGNETIRDFVRKYPLTTEFFGEEGKESETLRQYADRNDLTLEELENRVARHLVNQRDPEHDDCAWLCFSLSWCDKKTVFTGLGILLLIVILTSVYWL